MARKTYIGVDGVARKIKRGYIGIGVLENVSDEIVTNANVDNYFTVTNGTYYFNYDSSLSKWKSTNYNVNSSTATTTLTAKRGCTISFDWSVSSELSYDKLTIKIADATVVDAVSGTDSGSISSKNVSAGQTIVFTYTKDSSVYKNNDRGYISNLSITGTKEVGMARRIKKAYIGVGGIARLLYDYDTFDEIITNTNVDDYFTVTNGTYSFDYDSSLSSWKSTNYNVNSSIATTTLTAKRDCTVSFDWSVSSESNYDKLTITIGDTTVVDAVSGTKSGSVSSTNISAGQTIVFTYAKDGSQHTGSDRGFISNLHIVSTT